MYELLSDLLESSGVDRLDNEDPARMRASAQAKLAEITEVYHSPIAMSNEHLRGFFFKSANTQRDLRLFPQHHQTLDDYNRHTTSRPVVCAHYIVHLPSSHVLHTSLFHRGKPQLQKPGVPQSRSCTTMWTPAA